MPFVAGYELMRRWLQAQGIVTPATIIVLLGAPLSVGLNWLLVLGPPNIRIGFLGAPIAVVLTNITTVSVKHRVQMHNIDNNPQFLLLLLYCAIWAPKTAYAGFSRAIFLDLGPNIRLGIAGIVSTCSEWLVWDIVSFAASYLGEVEYAASAASSELTALAALHIVLIMRGADFIAILSDQQGFALGTAAGIRV
jgi:MATE family multidrug resistance protein